MKKPPVGATLCGCPGSGQARGLPLQIPPHPGVYECLVIRFNPARHVAVLLPNLQGGGIQKVMLTLAGALSDSGYQVDLVVCRLEGVLQDHIPPRARVVSLQAASAWAARLATFRAAPQDFAILMPNVLLPLKSTRTLPYLPDLARYLHREAPDTLLAARAYPNLEAVWARRLAQATTRVVISEHLHFSCSKLGSAKWRQVYLPRLLRRTYMAADAIVAVSDGVADDLAISTGIPRERISTIYNPVVTSAIQAKAREPIDHPWFAPGTPPVFLGAGRLSPQKDFPTLLRAFARLRAQQDEQDVRLIILGEGAERESLEALSRQLGIAASVSLPGFATNPFAYMARAACFVLSSAYEGLPTVLIEALACGCPIVSTDCPSGPREILGQERAKTLVPVRDVVALASGMAAVLRTPPDRAGLRSRAAQFSVDTALQKYCQVLWGDPPVHAIHG